MHSPPAASVTPQSAANDSSHDHSPQPAQEACHAERVAKRRAHRKSRFGCRNCKAKRIKCDEGKPECGNCQYRRLHCDYTSTGFVGGTISPLTVQTRSATKASSENNASAANAITDINVSQAELMYQWCSSTAGSIAVQKVGGTFWRTNVTELGLQHSYILQIMFAVTALHLASCRPTKRSDYLTQANNYYEKALPVVTSELANIDQDNCDAVLISVQLICMYAWGCGPEHGEYLAFSADGRSKWLPMFRGIRTTMETMSYSSFGKSQAAQMRARSKPLPQHSPPLAYQEPLSDLRDYILDASSRDQLACFLCAYDLLLNCYNNRYGGVDAEYHLVFGWLYMLEDDFLDAMQQHDPIPLVLYAYFAVLLNDMEGDWYMKGWTAHVLNGIWAALADEHKAHMRWPIESIGWIPP